MLHFSKLLWATLGPFLRFSSSTGLIGFGKKFKVQSCKPSGSYFLVPYDNIFKAHFVCVAFYLGFETTFTSLTSPRPRNFVTDLYPHLNPKEISDVQPGVALSPATTYDMLAQYIDLLSLTGRTPADILWYFLANGGFHTRKMKPHDGFLGPFIETIAECIVRHTLGNERAMLLGATINLVLSQPMERSQVDFHRVSKRDRAKQIESIKLLLREGARPVPSSFEQPPGYRWLSPVEELSRVKEICLYECPIDQGIIDVLRILPQGSAEIASHEFSRLFVEPTFRRTAQGLRFPHDNEVAGFLKTLIAGIAGTLSSTGTISATVQQEFLSPMLLWTTHQSMAQSCKVLLTAGAQVSADVRATSANYLSEKYGSAFIAACAIGDLEICKNFIDHVIKHAPGGEDVNTTSMRGQYSNAFTAACAHGNIRLCQTLLDYGADVNAISHSGSFGTALIAACSHGNIELCQTLLDQGANINTVSHSGNFGTALIAACAHGKFKLCQTLLDQGADVNAVSHSGDFGTALTAACAHGNIELCQTLLDHRAHINGISHSSAFGTALIAACAFGNIEICRILLEHEADANAVCSAGIYRTALIAAASWFKPSEDNRWQPRRHRDLPQDLALRLQMCNLLLEHKADVNSVVSGDGCDYIGTALIASCLRDDACLCQRLIDCGAKLDCTSGGLYRTAFSAAEYANEWAPELPAEEANKQNVAAIERAIRNPEKHLKPVTIKGRALMLLLDKHSST